MKKLAIIVALFFAVNAFGQNNAFDTLKTIAGISDSLPSISVRNISEAWRRLDPKLAALEDKLTVTEYKKVIDYIDSAFRELINAATEEYQRKKPKPKK